jgi:hypothetical protein
MPGKHLHEYWVTIPSGIHHYHTQDELNNDDWYMSQSVLECDSKRKAFELMDKYNGAYAEKMIYKNNKRYAKWLYTRPEDNKLSYDELWDKYYTGKRIQIVD